MHDVSVIVVAWNVKKLLDDCLVSVFKETRDIDFEVIYVDNGSHDGSIELVKEKFPLVRIIANKENMGFIKANNQGIRVADSRYVLLLNSDTIVLDNAIAKVVRFADQHPEGAVFGGKVLNADLTLQRSCFETYSAKNFFIMATFLYKLFPRSKFFGAPRMTWFKFDSVVEVDAVVGCFSLVRKSAILKVGLMDEDYFTYGDDLEWCYRFKKTGYKIMFTPEPTIIHYGGQTTKQAANKFTLQLFGSWLIFVKKHKGPLSHVMARLLVSLYMFIRIPYWIIVGIVKPSKRNLALSVVKTYLTGSLLAIFHWKKLLINFKTVKISRNFNPPML